MKKMIVLGLLGLFFTACGSKEEKNNEELSPSDIENITQTSQMNIEEISYEGTFKGKVKGKEVELKIDDSDFEISESGRKAKGTWSIINDGATVELEPTSGSVRVKYYGVSDNDTWVALTDSATYPDTEEYLKRIPD
ncbi:MAG: hypothetical protein ACK5IC_03475 [Moheibacter sp.]